MVPEGAVGLIAFLIFVAPGALFELIVSTRRPRPADTTFREINRVVLVSVLASFFAIVLALIPRLFEPRWLQPLIASVQVGDYWRGHFIQVAFGLSLVFLLSLLAAATLARIWIYRGPGGRNFDESQWYLIFRRKLPPGTKPYVIAVSASGERYQGNLVAYSQDISDPSVRDLTLGEPVHWQPNVDVQPRLLQNVQRVVLSGDQASQVLVTYLKAESRPTVRQSWSPRRR